MGCSPEVVITHVRTHLNGGNLACDGKVQELVADLHGQPTHKVGVHLHLQHHRLALPNLTVVTTVRKQAMTRYEANRIIAST